MEYIFSAGLRLKNLTEKVGSVLGFVAEVSTPVTEQLGPCCDRAATNRQWIIGETRGARVCVCVCVCVHI